MKRAIITAAALLLASTLVACGGDDEDGDEITVYAAASLTATFEDIAEQFESENDGVEVELNFGGSSDLVAQIQEGAPADVFASADEANMEKLTAEDLQGEDPRLFATNILQIVVPPDNPAGIETFADLAQEGLKLVICSPEVPCGAAAQSVAENAGVTLSPVSEEQSVTDVLGKVTSGEADAGLVYVTDVTAAGNDVLGIEFPESSSVVNSYPIATVADSDNSDVAQEFADYVLGDTGQQILADAGFGQP
jgi:molybdate transport system substrate-binding protein